MLWQILSLCVSLWTTLMVDQTCTNIANKIMHFKGVHFMCKCTMQQAKLCRRWPEQSENWGDGEGEGAERKQAVRMGEVSSYSKGTCEFVHELPLCTSPSCLNVSSSLSHSHCKSSKESTQLKSLFPGNWALMAQGGMKGMGTMCVRWGGG